MKNYLGLILFLFSFNKIIAFNEGDSLQLKENESIKIDSIMIIGNDKTEAFIILRELTFAEGDSVDNGSLKYNKERVYSLGLFNFVSVYAAKKNNANFVVIEVEESWYFYPLPFLNIQNSSLDKATIGMLFLYKNFRGRNETIDMKFGLGFDPFISASYSNPVIWSDPDISFSFRFSFVDLSNKSDIAEIQYGKEFEYDYYTAEIMLGRRLNLYNQLVTIAGFDYVQSPMFLPGRINASNNSIDRIPKASLVYIFDSRDLSQMPKDGFYISFAYTNKGMGINNVNYNILQFDYREYQPLFNELLFRWRFLGRHVFGKNIPFYDYSFFGYAEYIRGHRRDKREGENLMFSSFELRYPILEEWKFKLDLPLLPERLTSARIGINLEMFFDAGLTFNNHEVVFENQIDRGWGMGLTLLLLPHNAFRFEYAFDMDMNGEFIFGTGFSF